MTTARLIVNADDLGISAGVNRGIAEAHEHGLVTSASLMVRRPAADDAATYARANRELGVGLHLELGEWVYGADGWYAVREIVDCEDAAAVELEVEAQLATFRELVGRDPTHIDSHQHVHRSEPVSTVARVAAERLAVPLRHYTPQVRYLGEFHGQTGTGCPMPELVTADALVSLIESLPVGITELVCHPGYGDGLDSTYGRERELELRALCDPRVLDAVAARSIALCSFADIAI